jgi:hypothetical protein
MRGSLWALIAIGMIAAVQPASGQAAGYPFCIRGCDYGSGLGDCSFSSYQQCQAAASGRAATCAANPYFTARAESPANGSRLSRRRF